MDFDPYEEWPFKDEDRHFCSGVNSPGEVRGLARSGGHVGLVADRVSEKVLAELAMVRGSGLCVFVDSGAFSEVSFAGGTRTVARPFTEADWADRLATYKLVAREFKQDAFLVAPDAVGDQRETLVRLARYADEMFNLRAEEYAEIILPFQRGALGPADFVRVACGALGFADPILGIPSKKNATSAKQLAEDCRELAALAPWWTPRFHLLGMGPKSPRWDEQRAAIRASFPDAPVWSDSVGVRSEVGRTNGKGKGPRRMTAAQDVARSLGMTGSDVKAFGLAKVGAEDRQREVQAARRGGWYDPELESAPGVPLEEGCISYGPGGPFGEELQQQAELPLEAA